MGLELNNITYSERATSQFHNILYVIRAWFYEKEIIQTIFQAIWNKKSNGKNIDLWWWGWHKTEKIYTHLVSGNWKLDLIDPSDWQLKQSKKRLSYTNITISKWSSCDLWLYENIENIFCNQMTHHLNYREKIELFENAYNALKKWGRIIILDTTFPERWFLRYVFTWLQKLYKKYIWKGNDYYNITTQEYINMLQEAWFEIELEYTRHFYILKKLWEVCTKLWVLYPFMTQIIAVKK